MHVGGTKTLAIGIKHIVVDVFVAKRHARVLNEFVRDVVDGVD